MKTLNEVPRVKEIRTAHFSPCRRYRYSLVRIWEPSRPLCQFIGLNPSTADETTDDPTVRRCIRYAGDWGYGGLIMSNIFAYRSTDPRGMKEQADPVGPETDRWLIEDHERAAITVFAWGCHGTHRERCIEVAKLIPSGMALKVTKAGHPQHPLYLRADLKPAEFPGY